MFGFVGTRTNQRENRFGMEVQRLPLVVEPRERTRVARVRSDCGERRGGLFHEPLGAMPLGLLKGRGHFAEFAPSY